VEEDVNHAMQATSGLRQSQNSLVARLSEWWDNDYLPSHPEFVDEYYGKVRKRYLDVIGVDLDALRHWKPTQVQTTVDLSLLPPPPQFDEPAVKILNHDEESASETESEMNSSTASTSSSISLSHSHNSSVTPKLEAEAVSANKEFYDCIRPNDDDGSELDIEIATKLKPTKRRRSFPSGLSLLEMLRDENETSRVSKVQKTSALRNS
jgi:hypothetical protein